MLRAIKFGLLIAVVAIIYLAWSALSAVPLTAPTMIPFGLIA